MSDMGHRMTSETKHKGGKRDGAGRPRGRIYTERILVAVTPKQKEKFFALGGSSWVKKMIDEAEK